MNYIFDMDRIIVRDDASVLLAEMTFQPVSEKIRTVKFSFIEDTVRGRIAANRLLTLVSEKLRYDGAKAAPGCLFSHLWFERHPAYADILPRKPRKALHIKPMQKQIIGI